MLFQVLRNIYKSNTVHKCTLKTTAQYMALPYSTVQHAQYFSTVHFLTVQFSKTKLQK